MVLEATFICADSSEWMRNGDYAPTRLEAQHDAISLICGAKLQSNPESAVGVLSYGKSPTTLITLTADLGKVLNSISSIKIQGQLKFSEGIQVSQLALKHRPNKNQRQRIIAFVGSPILDDIKELDKLGKRLKKIKLLLMLLILEKNLKTLKN